LDSGRRASSQPNVTGVPLLGTRHCTRGSSITLAPAGDRNRASPAVAVRNTFRSRRIRKLSGNRPALNSLKLPLSSSNSKDRAPAFPRERMGQSMFQIDGPTQVSDSSDEARYYLCLHSGTKFRKMNSDTKNCNPRKNYPRYGFFYYPTRRSPRAGVVTPAGRICQGKSNERHQLSRLAITSRVLQKNRMTYMHGSPIALRFWALAQQVWHVPVAREVQGAFQRQNVIILPGLLILLLTPPDFPSDKHANHSQAPHRQLWPRPRTRKPRDQRETA
jgi:hypothetical protein